VIQPSTAVHAASSAARPAVMRPDAEATPLRQPPRSPIETRAKKRRLESQLTPPSNNDVISQLDGAYSPVSPQSPDVVGPLLAITFAPDTTPTSTTAILPTTSEARGAPVGPRMPAAPPQAQPAAQPPSPEPDVPTPSAFQDMAEEGPPSPPRPSHGRAYAAVAARPPPLPPWHLPQT
jgi:hypothetical protein